MRMLGFQAGGERRRRRAGSARRAGAVGWSGRPAIGCAIALVFALVEGVARAERWPDPRAFGAPAGHLELLLAVPLGLAGLAGGYSLGAIRRYHLRTWVRPWFIAAALATPIVLVSLPLCAGVIASRFLFDDHFADTALVAATRFMALAAGAVWLVYEATAAQRQHEHDLYSAQRPSDRSTRAMRWMAGLFGALALGSLGWGISASVLPR